MTGFEVYGLYCGLKAHFTIGNSYDFIKYGGRVRSKFETYKKRSDYHFFEYLSKKFTSKEIVPVLLSSFVTDELTWIGDFTEDFNIAEEKYLLWRKKYESLSRVFEDDIKNIKSLLADKHLKFIDLFDITKDKHPAIFRFLLYDMITIETFIILNEIQDFYNVFDKKFSDDPLWVQWKFRCERYRPFLPIEKNKFKSILKSLFV